MADDKLDSLFARINTYEPDSIKYPDDYFAYISCIEALAALKQGNYGVGGLLVDREKNIVTQGHNQMFSPFFRSDLHSEMVIMNAFEENNKHEVQMKNYTLYTSLEPCPMCLVRLIFTGIGRVLYVAEDPFGGMAHALETLPPAWRQLASGRQFFGEARCSPELKFLAFDICMSNANVLYAKLQQR
jgi:tRNA(Arg) A34 adenosine deaminase TadA